MTVDTYTATIYCGLQVGYDPKLIHSVAAARDVCQRYCDDVGLCVTVTETTFVYKGMSEPGVIVGLINYPRLPFEPYQIREYAVRLARRLMETLGQNRVSVVLPSETIMLGLPEPELGDRAV